jgi:glutamine synthetase type III
MQARRDVNLTHYVGMIEMEALCMIDMIVQQIVPALKVTCRVCGASLSTLERRRA